MRRRRRWSSRQTTIRRGSPACAAATPARSRSRTSCATRDRRCRAATHTGETYDLVVVGGGHQRPRRRVLLRQERRPRTRRDLVLDNHDDFGGHAKRNEFVHDGKNADRLTAARSTSSRRSATTCVAASCSSIGVDLARFVKSNDRWPASIGSLNLRGGHFFDRETWGANELVGASGGCRGRGGAAATRRNISRMMPLSAEARADMIRIQDPNQPDYMAGLSTRRRRRRGSRR